jgi:hypothetical protein
MMKNPLSNDVRVEATETPGRPLRVNLALSMLYLSLAISVARVSVTWLGFGDFFPPEYLFTIILILLGTSSFFQGSPWMDLVGVLFVPIAAWLYYMMAKGKNWARITLLIYVLLETAASILSLSLAGAKLVPMFDPISQTPPAFSDSLIRDFLPILQLVLRITAVTLLFGRVSSNWFEAMKTRNQSS